MRSMWAMANCIRACSARRDVSSIEGTDIRALDPARLAEPPEIATIDVSFISLKLVLPAVHKLLAPGARLLALIKPQFEAGRAHIRKGIVRDPQMHAAVCDEIAGFAASLGFRVMGTIKSPFAGRRRKPRVLPRGGP